MVYGNTRIASKELWILGERVGLFVRLTYVYRHFGVGISPLFLHNLGLGVRKFTLHYNSLSFRLLLSGQIIKPREHKDDRSYSLVTPTCIVSPLYPIRHHLKPQSPSLAKPYSRQQPLLVIYLKYKTHSPPPIGVGMEQFNVRQNNFLSTSPEIFGQCRFLHSLISRRLCVWTFGLCLRSESQAIRSSASSWSSFTCTPSSSISIFTYSLPEIRENSRFCCSR